MPSPASARSGALAIISLTAFPGGDMGGPGEDAGDESGGEAGENPEAGMPDGEDQPFVGNAPTEGAETEPAAPEE